MGAVVGDTYVTDVGCVIATPALLQCSTNLVPNLLDVALYMSVRIDIEVIGPRNVETTITPDK